jgi:hypothetical protein
MVRPVSHTVKQQHAVFDEHVVRILWIRNSVTGTAVQLHALAHA